MSTRKIEFAEGEYYHVYSRGVERRKIFMDEDDYERFTRLLYAANSTMPVHLGRRQGVALADIPRGGPIVAIGAWCLMPNHFHLLLKEIKENGISEFLHKLLTAYSMYFNIKYQRKGSLFEGPFSAKHLDSDRYLKHQYAYIHLNPMGIIESRWKEKIIKDAKKTKKFLDSYRYSSLQDYAGIERGEDLIVMPELFPKYFKSAPDFRKMLEEWLNFTLL